MKFDLHNLAEDMSTNDKREATTAIIDAASMMMVRYKLNPAAFAILTFLSTMVEEGEEKDLGEWISFYAKMQFDKRFGAGSTDFVTDKFQARLKNIENGKDLRETLTSIFDDLKTRR
jgi:hypothetical protein